MYRGGPPPYNRAMHILSASVGNYVDVSKKTYSKAEKASVMRRWVDVRTYIPARVMLRSSKTTSISSGPCWWLKRFGEDSRKPEVNRALKNPCRRMSEGDVIDRRWTDRLYENDSV